MANNLDVKINIDIEGIESFNSQTPQNATWGTINEPFEANHFCQNDAGDGRWYQVLHAGQRLTFSILSDENSTILIEYIKLSLIGTLDNTQQSIRGQWGQVLDLSQTTGAVGEHGAYYLTKTDDEPNQNYEMVANENLQDRSPNLAYSIIFSFVDSISGIVRYCKVDPLVKTSAREH